MTDTNVVRNRLIRLPTDLSEAQLQLLNTLLNTTFTGLTLEEITPELMRVASARRRRGLRAHQPGGLLCHGGAGGPGAAPVHTAGLAHLLEQPEYQSLERAQPLMSYLSEDRTPPASPCPRTTP